MRDSKERQRIFFNRRNFVIEFSGRWCGRQHSFANCRFQKIQPSARALSLRKIKLLTVRYCLPILKSTDRTSTDSLISLVVPLLRFLALYHSFSFRPREKEKSEKIRSARERPLSISRVSRGKSRSFGKEEPGGGHRKERIFMTSSAENFPLHQVQFSILIIAMHIPPTARWRRSPFREVMENKQGKYRPVYNAAISGTLLKKKSRICE